MSKITLENMEFHAYHGVLEHEKVNGNIFHVTVEVEVDTETAERTDNLEDTLNYQLVYDVIKKQIEIPSNLIEHVAGRIVDALMRRFEKIECLVLTLSKLNPPLKGKVAKATISITKSRG